MDSLEVEAARRGVTPAFLRAERLQKLRVSVLGKLGETKAPISKEALAGLGSAFWPYTYGQADNYDDALAGASRRIAELKESFESSGELPLELWSLVEAMEVPDTHIQFMGACRWVDQGLPIITMGHRYAAALMATSAPPEVLEDVKPPWLAFMIEIPPIGLVVYDENGVSDEIVRILVWTENLPFGTGWAYFTMSPTESLTLWFLDRVDKLADPDDDPSQWDALPFGLRQDDRDHRLRVLIHRLILNTCLAMSSPDNLKPIGKASSKSWSGPSKRTLRDPEFRRFRVGKPINIDCREAIRDFVDGTRKKSSISVQVLVRGHWKRQVHGPNRALRKVIWVEPYWKGPEESPQLVRPHTLREDT